MHFSTPLLSILATLATLTIAHDHHNKPKKEPSKEPSCGAPFCARGEAMAHAKASILAEHEAKVVAIIIPTATSSVAGAKASSLN
jgi:hypothetical protein